MFETPARIRQALTNFSDLEANAQLVPIGGEPLAPVSLTRSEDGVSFSGFVPSEPGTYVLEITFFGRFADNATPSFLGRLTSDQFAVVEGDTVSPTFSSPLDTIGRPQDGGDEDQDQLGLLDELLWGADPADADSDDDGIPDGQDCRPMTSSDYRIQDGGTIEDCDADGFRRIDLPFTPVGNDCEDTAADVNPGAEDICEDEVDSDCNPATCPLEDSEGPLIEIIDPVADEVVGCHRRVQVNLQDPAGVTSGRVRIIEVATGAETDLALASVSEPRWQTARFEGASTWLTDGAHRLVVEADDTRGNRSVAEIPIVFSLQVPSVSLVPDSVGLRDTPFDVTVEASAPGGIARITLYRASWPLGGDIERDGEVELGVASTSPATFTVDPSSLANGAYGIYAVVEDTAGNLSQPDESFRPGGTPLATDADFYCIFESGEGNIPVRRLQVGEVTDPNLIPATMRDHLDEAIQAANAVDPAALLVSIRGFGIQPDGRIGLDQDVGGRGKWWRYEFHNEAVERHIEVTWYSANYGIANPEVDVTEDYPFLVGPPIVNPAALTDSDTAAAAYGAAGCPALTGVEEDDIRYEHDETFAMSDIVRILSETDGDWTARAGTLEVYRTCE